MMDDPTPIEQARAGRWAVEFLDKRVDRLGPSAMVGADWAKEVLSKHADEMDPPETETMESLRAERDELRAAIARAEDAADASRAERDAANAALARSRATHDEAEAAWGRAQQKPQVWCAGDHEPPMTNPSLSLLPLLDKHGRRWSRWYANCWCCHNEHGKQLPPHPGLLRWRELLNDFGPLTEVLR